MAGIERWMVFGGSWGSTLALAYAQAHAERVSELVLRGIFTFRQKEVDWLYRYGASEVYPDKWEQFLAVIPEHERGDLVHAYRRRLTGEDSATRLVAAKAWSRWEAETVSLRPSPETIGAHTSDSFAVAIARIENHYMAHRGWLEEGQLLSHANRLRGIPGVIAQGRYDMCTPPAAAWDLHRAWPESQLRIVHGGHLFSEPEVLDALVRATDEFASR
jgi:proline iminopeptidase